MSRWGASTSSTRPTPSAAPYGPASPLPTIPRCSNLPGRFDPATRPRRPRVPAVEPRVCSTGGAALKQDQRESESTAGVSARAWGSKISFTVSNRACPSRSSLPRSRSGLDGIGGATSIPPPPRSPPPLPTPSSLPNLFFLLSPPCAYRLRAAQVRAGGERQGDAVGLLRGHHRAVPPRPPLPRRRLGAPVGHVSGPSLGPRSRDAEHTGDAHAAGATTGRVAYIEVHMHDAPLRYLRRWWSGLCIFMHEFFGDGWPSCRGDAEPGPCETQRHRQPCTGPK